MKSQTPQPNYVTHEDLKKELQIFKKEFKEELKEELKTELKEEMDQMFQKYTNDVLNKFDQVMREMELVREDRELAVYQTREIRDQVENHEKRLKKLENH